MDVNIFILFITFLISLLLVMTTIPVVIRLVISKNLFDVPDGERKIHDSIKPTMGGIAIFFATIITSTFFIAALELDYSWIFVAGLIIMFFTGFKDDLVHIPATKKLLVQVFTSLVVIQIAQIEINNFLGLFGIFEIADWIALPFTLLTFIFIINAYNLIDGVDGLAAGVGSIASAFFGIWFYSNGEMGFAVLAFSLFGALLGFLYYNFSPAKIFMGDTGSLVIGLILSILAVTSIHKVGQYGTHSLDVHHANVINYAIAVLIIPIYDTVRVFTFRILKRMSPFQPGKDHIHHAMLRVGFTHKSLSLSIFAINFILIGLTAILSYFNFDINIVFWSLIIASTLILPTFSVKRRLLRRVGFDLFPQVNSDIVTSPKRELSDVVFEMKATDDPEMDRVNQGNLLQN
jgi:UDP-GlcNAc:undecaprenyl-phosphate GlcNAc-1-phosphate transferase